MKACGSRAKHLTGIEAVNGCRRDRALVCCPTIRGDPLPVLHPRASDHFIADGSTTFLGCPRCCDPQNVPPDLADCFTDLERKQFLWIDRLRNAVVLADELAAEPARICRPNIEGHDRRDVPEDLPHDLLGDLPGLLVREDEPK